MKILIIGYGKMGKSIEAIALQNNHEVVGHIDINEQESERIDKISSADVVFEFTNPQAAVSNLYMCFEQQVPVVCGSTGWYNQLPRVEEACKSNNATLFYAPNFSLGVNILSEINRKLAEIMNHFPEYQPEIQEIHHIHKKDAPSGTAISLANSIIQALERKTLWVNHHTTNRSELPVISERTDNVPGTHTISYESDVDRLELTHIAKSREGFARGALLAGTFIQNKTGIFTMKDIINI